MIKDLDVLKDLIVLNTIGSSVFDYYVNQGVTDITLYTMTIWFLLSGRKVSGVR